MAHFAPTHPTRRTRLLNLLVVAVIALATFVALPFAAKAAPHAAPVAQSDIPECANIPRPTRLSTNLRVVNFREDTIEVSLHGTGGITQRVLIEAGKSHDITVVPGVSVEWRHLLADGQTSIRYPITLTIGVHCEVIGEPPGSETPGSETPTTEPTATEVATAESPTAEADNHACPLPATQEDRFPLEAGRVLVREQKYYSESGNHYLIFQDDGNTVVYSAADEYIWGLESITENYAQTQSVQIQSDGNFVVRGENDEFIWSALDENPDATAYLNLTAEGVLQIVSAASCAVLWASDGDLNQATPVAPTTPTAEPTAEATAEPTAEATAEPTAEATAEPTAEATATPEPTVAPTAEPTPEPTPELTACTQEDFVAAVQAGEQSGTITLDGSCLYTLTIAGDNWNGGSGAFVFNATVIEGNGAVIERSASAPKFRIFGLRAQSGTTVRNLTFRNGANTKAGGALYAVTDLTLENVTFEGNSSDDVGGAIAASKNLTLRDVTIKNGSANRGGAIFAWGSATLEDVVLEGNSASDMGGAIGSQQNLTLTNVTLKANTGGEGGAIAQFSGDLTIHNTSLIANSGSKQGGAIHKQAGKLQIINTLFAQNRVEDGNGAAIFLGGEVDPTAQIVNSTITDNEENLGSAITMWSPLTVQNTIIANHAAAITVGTAKTTLTENYNLFASNLLDVRLLNDAAYTRGSNSVNAPDPQFVDAAALNYALKANSPAVDKGTDTVLNAATLTTDAAALPRPYSGTLVDIGAHELQGEGGPALSIVKQGPHWIVAGEEADYSLTVANDGVRSAESLVVTDLLPDGAIYVADSATQNGAFANDTLTWQIGTLAPGDNVFLEYTIVASQTLVSLDYSVQSTTEAAVIAAGKVVSSPLNSKIMASTGFLPRPDGFSFYNYGKDGADHDQDLTVEDMIFIFGEDIVCKSKNPCVLTSTAQAWRTKWLGFLEGGHCAGMAMGSLNIFANASVAPDQFQPAANFTFDLTKASARRYVALYAATQGSAPADSSALQASGYEWSPATIYTNTASGMAWITNPVDVLDELINNLSDPNAGDRYRLSFRNYPPRPGVDGGGGHTVVPYAVEKLNDNEYLIYIYENNVPNNFDLSIKINRATGNWSYVGTTRPDKPLNKYYGDKTSNNLTLTSWQWASTFPKECETLCPTPASTPTTGAAQATVGTVEVQLNGEGYQLVTRSDGKQVGFDPNTGEWISEIDGAQAVDVLLGLGLNIPPSIQIPHETGMSYDVQVASRETAYGNTEAPADLYIAGPGFAVNVTDLVLDSPAAQPSVEADAPSDTAAEPTDTTTDTPADTPAADTLNLNVDLDQKRIVIEPGVDDAETPSISLSVSQPDGSDFSVDVKSVNVTAGHAVAVAFNEDNQSITIEGNESGATDYQVEVNRINTGGTTDTFVSDGVSDEGNAGVTLNVGDDWNGQDAPAIQLEESSTLPEPATESDSATASDTAEPATPVVLCDATDVAAPLDGGVMVRFVNESGGTVIILWRESEDNLVEYHQLEADSYVDQETFESHTWLAEDGAGNLLLEYTASAETTQCVLIQQP